MKEQNYEAGFGSAVIIGIIAVALLGGGVYYASTKDDMAQKSPDSKEMMGTQETTKDDMAAEEEMKDEMDTDMKEMDEMSGSDEMETSDTAEMMKKDEMESDGGSEEMLEKEMESSTEAAGEYTTFTSLTDAQAAAAAGDTLLFFHASWCPSCRALEADIKASLGDIPAGVTIIEVDYDSATELRSKYGVVRQHTLVQIDADGNKVKTLTGLSNTLEQVVAQL